MIKLNFFQKKLYVRWIDSRIARLRALCESEVQGLEDLKND